MCEHIFKPIEHIDAGIKYPTIMFTKEVCEKCGEERDSYSYDSLMID